MKNNLILLVASILLAFSASAQQGMGIGNSNPQEMLDVSGAIKLGTTSNTNTGTIRWNGANFQGYDGTQWVNLDGAGGADSDWTITGINQYSAVSGNVGIGETNPIFKLDVGHPGANQQIRVRGNWVSNHANNARANFIDWNFGVGAGRAGSAGDATVMWSFNGAGRGILFASTSNGLSQHFGQMQHNMYIQGSDGNVGIGTTAPAAKLDVQGGTIAIDGDGTGGSAGYALPAQDGTNGQVLTTDGSGNATWQNSSIAVENFLGELNNAPAIVGSNGGTASFNAVQNTDNTVFSVSATGVTILKAGVITWNYDQDLRTSGGSYAQLFALINGSSVVQSLMSHTGGAWDGIHNGGSYYVNAGDRLDFQFGGPAIYSSMDNGLWGRMSITWMGTL